MSNKIRISQSGSGAPSAIVPHFKGELYLDETSGELWRGYNTVSGAFIKMVDSSILNASTGNYVLKSGDTMTGDLRVNASVYITQKLGVGGIAGAESLHVGDGVGQHRIVVDSGSSTIGDISFRRAGTTIGMVGLVDDNTFRLSGGSYNTLIQGPYGTTRMIINNTSGFVGINRLDPSFYLDISGNFRSKGATIDGSLYVLGNVGVGTSNPSTRLHVYDAKNGGKTRIIIENNGSTGHAAGIDFDVYYNNPTRSSIVYDFEGTQFVSSHGMNYVSGRNGMSNHWFRDLSGTVQLAIRDNGYVGIKEPSPIATLDVSGNVSFDGSLWMNGQRILNLGNPTSSSDATNKWYVDNSIFLQKLYDVSIVSIAHAQTLVYDASTLKWENTDTVDITTVMPTYAYIDMSINALKSYTDASLVLLKSYTDASLVLLKTDLNASLGLYVKKAGDTMTDNLTINTSLYVLGNASIGVSITSPIFRNSTYSYHSDGNMYVSQFNYFLSTGLIRLNNLLIDNTATPVYIHASRPMYVYADGGSAMGIGSNGSTGLIYMTATADISVSAKMYMNSSLYLMAPSNVSTNYTLYYNTTSKEVTYALSPAGGTGTGSSYLRTLLDASITSPSEGQFITYDADTSTWQNYTIPTVNASDFFVSKYDTDVQFPGNLTIQGRLNMGSGIYINKNSSTSFPSGVGNVFVGDRAGNATTTGSNNTAIGQEAGYTNVTGAENVFVGQYAGYYVRSTGNTVVGVRANSDALQDQNYSTAIGYYALSANRGLGSTALGSWAGASMSFSIYNTIIGAYALYYQVGYKNDYNVAVGAYSGFKNLDGSYNTYLGTFSGYDNSKGGYNIFLGYGAGGKETESNRLYIANSSTSTPLIYGRFDTSALLIYGSLDVSTTLKVYGTTTLKRTEATGLYYVPGYNNGISWSDANGLYVGHTSYAYWYITSAATETGAITGYTQALPRFYITANGSVGIGKVPQFNLDVSGNLYTSGNVHIDASINIDGSIYQWNTLFVGGSGTSLWDVSTDNTTVYLHDPSDNVQLSYIEMQENGGALLLVDMPCSSTVTGSEQSYSMNIDGSIALKIYGIGASTAISETAVVVQANYFALGDPQTNGSWRLKVDTSGNLSVQKRVSGSWIEKGNFN